MSGHHHGHNQDRVTAPWPRPDRADSGGGHRVDTPVSSPGTTHGRVVAWTGFVFGSVTSIAANVLHAWLPAEDMPPGWTPGLAPQLGAAIWPIGLLLSVEVLSRARWQHGRWWRLARYGGAGTVALGSAIISYGHVRDVLLAWGYGPMGASVGPLTLDGLMVVSGFALLSMTTTGRATAITPLASTAMAANTTATQKNSASDQSQVAQAALDRPTAPVASGHGPTVATVSDTVATRADSEDSGADTRRSTARALHAQGWSHGRIAAELEVSKRSVRRYLSALSDTENGSVEGISETPKPDETWPGEINTNHHQPLERVLT